jgi:hypothetical protein
LAKANFGFNLDLELWTIILTDHFTWRWCCKANLIKRILSFARLYAGCKIWDTRFSKSTRILGVQEFTTNQATACETVYAPYLPYLLSICGL